MKIFRDRSPKLPSTFYSVASLLLIFQMLQSCATHHSQFGSQKPAVIQDNFDSPANIAHSFYLIGDAGNADQPGPQKVLSVFEQRLQAADSASTLLFLGDNIYPSGMPNNGSSFRAAAEGKINRQLALAKKFKGKTIFIPGNHDWYNGVDGLREQEKYVNDYLKQKKAFLPRKNCGIDKLDINEYTALIVIDSEWFLQDWDKHPKINEDCDIKTREQFYLELQSEINKNQNKTTIIAMHHPLMSNGPHGGQFSLEKQLFPIKRIPLPVIGSVINLLRKTTGASPADLQNKKYNAFARRIRAMIQDKRNVIVVSGHEHNLQYIDNLGIKQVVSGAGSKAEAARAINPGDFSFGRGGYAVIDVHKNGAAKLSFFGLDSQGNEALLFKTQPLSAKPKVNLREYPAQFKATKDTSVYSAKMTTKGAAYRFLWGNHYRKYYGMKIRAKTVSLDTIYGGLKPTISGGGQQSLSLRLEDKNGKEYVMRGLRKSATRFIQSVEAFRDQSVEKDFRDTYAEDFVLDFYTTSHPYTPFVVGKLADRVGISHTNPMLYYVPKQRALGAFNQDFGDQLYMIEERPTDEWKNLPSFGNPDKIVSTEDVLANVVADEKYEVDEKSFIRARMFDMLIGDWDRHQDQWRWGQYKKDGKVIYRPIPRDRDQAFAKYDGNLLLLLMKMPPLRHMKKFSADLKNVKWFNRNGHPLDLAFVVQAEEKDWVEQAKFVSENLSDAAIDKAFESVPNEVKDETIARIKSQLKARKKHLERYAREYYKLLQKTVLVVGTEKKDRFVIKRSSNATHVQVYRIKKDGEQLVHDRVYQSNQTRELWVYGLNDEDVFEVSGYGRRKIRLRLLGGQDNDTYSISSGRKVTIYDFKSNNVITNPAGAKMVLSNDYELNTYDYKKPKFNVFAGYPNAGFNPDDGIKVGGVINYTVNGFKRAPYSQRHSVKGNYYFATGGFELAYKGTFPEAMGKWNLLIDALYTSPNFSINFFGIGNETENYQKEVGRDYNRVKIRTVRITPSVQWVGEMGGSFTTQLSFERVQIANTPNRLVTFPGVVNADVFNYNNFADINAAYRFENYDNVSNPTLGITFWLLGGYKINIDETAQKFPYAESALGFNYRISSDGKLSLATLVKGKTMFDDNYEFWQAPTVGGDLDLRGFRNQRFSGKTTLYQSTDLRYNLGNLRTGFVPMTYGVFGGFDYGRVWIKNDTSDRWHQSVGGGVWLNGVNLITTKLSYFYSSDGGRVSFGLGFGF